MNYINSLVKILKLLSVKILQMHIAERNSFCDVKSLGYSRIPKCLSSKLICAKNAIQCI